jgi:hypothetical protein
MLQTLIDVFSTPEQAPWNCVDPHDVRSNDSMRCDAMEGEKKRTKEELEELRGERVRVRLWGGCVRGFLNDRRERERE